MLALTVVALALFSIERLQLALTSLGLLTLIALIFALSPYPGVAPMMFFEGFAHEALIAVCALMTLGQGLVRTGALEPVGRILGGLWQRCRTVVTVDALGRGSVRFRQQHPDRSAAAAHSTPVCLRTRKSPSKILIPMGFATLVGGMATTIGTSTNLLVIGIAKDLGVVEFSMFDLSYPLLRRRGGPTVSVVNCPTTVA